MAVKLKMEGSEKEGFVCKNGFRCTFGYPGFGNGWFVLFLWLFCKFHILSEASILKDGRNELLGVGLCGAVRSLSVS